MKNNKNMLQARDLLTKVGDLIPHLGTDVFEDQFYDTTRKIFCNDQCNVFVFDRNLESRPHCAFSAASERNMRDLTLAATDEYVSRGYLTDPTLKWAQRRGSVNGSSHTKVVSRQEIANLGYRVRFYDRARVRQKMAVVSSYEDLTVYLNFYRNPGQEDFDTSDFENLELFGCTFGRLFQKHLSLKNFQVTAPMPEGSLLHQEGRKHLIERMRDVFLDSDAGLTPRESDVCAAIAIGMTGVGIGLEFGISLNTVATHRKRAYAKLGISSQSELFLRHHEIVSRQMAIQLKH